MFDVFFRVNENRKFNHLIKFKHAKIESPTYHRFGKQSGV